MVLLMAFTTREAEVSEGILPGNRAPEIHLQDLSFTGKYTLVQFWAAYDAKSRAENILLHNKVAALQREDLQMVSLSFDPSYSVFEETVKADKLDLSQQFNVQVGEQDKWFSKYKLDRGFGNMLINPEGIIIAINVNPEEMQAGLM